MSYKSFISYKAANIGKATAITFVFLRFFVDLLLQGVNTFYSRDVNLILLSTMACFN